MWLLSSLFGFYIALIYAVIILIFWVIAFRKWKQYPLQKTRYIFLLCSHIFLFFIIPELVFRFAIKIKGIGFEDYWHSYGLTIPYPLFLDNILFSSHNFYFYVTVFITFVVLPIVIFIHGKRFCSYLCPFGILSETSGDIFRKKSHKANKFNSLTKLRWLFLILSLLFIFIYYYTGFSQQNVKLFKKFIIHYSIVFYFYIGFILNILLFYFIGNRFFCRFLCPLSQFMEYVGSRSSMPVITSTGNCSDCKVCDENCQMGIEVSNLIKNDKEISLGNSTCIYCGICVSLCPQKALKIDFGVIEADNPKSNFL
ncbi:MAG: 4Fe-4S binding protein [Candidatus Hydrogenedentota bacterium]